MTGPAIAEALETTKNTMARARQRYVQLGLKGALSRRPTRLVQDNPNTHTLGSRYEAFSPEEAHRLAAKLGSTTRLSMAVGAGCGSGDSDVH